MDFQTLDPIDTDLILSEVSHLIGRDGHVLIQKGPFCLYDLPYTNSLLKKYNVSMARIMYLKPKECYTWHHDTTPRIHFPLITNPSCLFILEDNVYRMPVGNAYYVDTRKKHTALNGSSQDFLRYHIVGIVDEMV